MSEVAHALTASIIIPTRNRPRRLVDAVRSLFEQDMAAEAYEIIVVDDHGAPPLQRDDLLRAVECSGKAQSERPELEVVLSSGRGVNAARNTGIEHARADLFVFVDDDVLAPTTWLRSITGAAARHPKAACLGGPYDLAGPRPRRLCRRCARGGFGGLEFLPEQGEGPIDEVWGANMTVRRSAIEQIGPFDGRLSGAGDETVWQRRLQAAGGRIVFVPSAQLHHVRTADEMRPLALAKQRFRREATRVDSLRLEGTPIPSVMGSAMRCLGHGLRRGCVGGLIDAAGYLGLGWGRWTRRPPADV